MSFVEDMRLLTLLFQTFRASQDDVLPILFQIERVAKRVQDSVRVEQAYARRHTKDTVLRAMRRDFLALLGEKPKHEAKHEAKHARHARHAPPNDL